MTSAGYFITGTDTGVGKTLVACALLHAFVRAGQRVVGMKPVAAGGQLSPEGLLNDDVVQLRAGGNVACELELVNPYCFEAAIAPHIAAAQAGVTIDLSTIKGAYARLAAQSDKVIVEGAGGFCVPLNRTENTADLAQQLQLPVIVVVGLRLGCLNHALLTAHSIRARGLTFAGWIANHIDPAMPAADANVAALKERLAAPLLAVIAYAHPPDPHHVAGQLDLSALN
jgi:dethiobiotin synthetase